jgi:hypothetical protein
MSGEFEKQIKKITNDKSAEKLEEIINSAGQDFPCLTCPSNEECATFKWFKKWFGEVSAKK